MFCMSSGITDLILLRASVVLFLSVANNGTFGAGWITEVLNSSPTIAVYSGTIIGNISLYVPVLINTVVFGIAALNIAVFDPANSPLVTMFTNCSALATPSDSATNDRSTTCTALSSIATSFKNWKLVGISFDKI